VIEVFIVTALILLNGLFALSELAVVSSRPARLKAMQAAGRPGAASALALTNDPSRFLSAVQIGITLIGVINGAYSGETFGAHAATALIEAGMPEHIADPVGYGLVIAIITYLSVIAGELVPKTLALRNAEGIACSVAPAMTWFSRAAGPAVWMLDSSTRIVFRLLGLDVHAQNAVSDEEIRTLIAEAETAGVIEKSERQMISGVMRLADRAVVGLMTNRTDVDWIDVSATDDEIRQQLIETPHSRLPVGEGSSDSLIGVVQKRDVLTSVLSGQKLDIRSLIRPAPIVPDTMDALDVLSVLRNSSVPMALIHDEYGHFEGIVTPADVLEAIAGAFKSDTEGDEPHAIQRDDGSWLIAGAMPVDEMAERIGLTLPEPRNYETVAGFVLSQLQRIPKTGELFELKGWRFEVVDLDGRRVDKILATPPRKKA
jgi:putative hemolysin